MLCYWSSVSMLTDGHSCRSVQADGEMAANEIFVLPLE